MQRALEAALETEPSEQDEGLIKGYELEVLLNHLEQTGVDDETLGRLEWAYFPALEHGQRTPRALYSAGSRRPDLFVEMSCRVFRAKQERRKRKPTEEEVLAMDHAWHVLNAWRVVPGTDKDGRIDATHLRDWIRKARASLRERDRADRR